MTGMRRIGDRLDGLGESPVWSVAEQALYWVDINAGLVQTWRQADGVVARWTLPERVGSLSPAADGALVVGLQSGFARFDPRTRKITALAPHLEPADWRLNDGKCDRQGRFWSGTMGMTDRSPRTRFYRLDGHGCHAMIDGLSVPNGLAWSADGTTMYFTDSPTRTIWACDYDIATGTPGPRRVFAQTDADSAPDGATIDAEGYLWSARYGGSCVVRHAPDGSVDRVLKVPASQVTSCAFGGPDLTTLFITTARQRLNEAQLADQPLAGALFACEPGVRGVAEVAFAF